MRTPAGISAFFRFARFSDKVDLDVQAAVARLLGWRNPAASQRLRVRQLLRLGI